VYKPELAEVLRRHLGSVEAPRELWERIETPRVPGRIPTRHAGVRALLLVTAAVLVAVVVFHPRTVEVEYRMPAHDLTLRAPKAQPTAEAVAAACLLCHAGA
jgi:hypothetical protein